MYRDFISHWQGEQGRRLDLEIGERCGDRADDVFVRSLGRYLEWDLLKVGRLARELDFEIGVDRGGRSVSFG